MERVDLIANDDHPVDVHRPVALEAAKAFRRREPIANTLPSPTHGVLLTGPILCPC
jgi:hypothetical protein